MYASSWLLHHLQHLDGCLDRVRRHLVYVLKGDVRRGEPSVLLHDHVRDPVAERCWSGSEGLSVRAQPHSQAKTSRQAAYVGGASGGGAALGSTEGGSVRLD